MPGGSINYSAKGGVLCADLRDRVGYDAKAEGPPSPYGDSAQVWSRLATLWAHVDVLDGQELLRAKEIHAEVRIKVTIRYNALVTAAGRFVWDNQFCYPVSIVADCLKRRMECLCYLRPQESV